jgi:hypothetical protein
MEYIRDPAGRLVFTVDRKNKVVERLEKGWVTRIEFKDGGTVEVTHYKKTK